MSRGNLRSNAGGVERWGGAVQSTHRQIAQGVLVSVPSISKLLARFLTPGPRFLVCPLLWHHLAASPSLAPPTPAAQPAFPPAFPRPPHHVESLHHNLLSPRPEVKELVWSRRPSTSESVQKGPALRQKTKHWGLEQIRGAHRLPAHRSRPRGRRCGLVAFMPKRFPLSHAISMRTVFEAVVGPHRASPKTAGPLPWTPGRAQPLQTPGLC